MPLPNLSGKSFLSTSPTFDTYQSGADSYREKVKEKIQNSPRRSANYSDYSRSIDLSISKDESFRPVSRHRSINVNNNNNSQLNETTNGYRLKSAANDPKNISRLKSARNRQIVFYNNNNNLDESIDDETNNNNNNNLDLKKELNRRNNTRNRNFNTSPLVSDDDFSVNINNKNEKQNRNYNNNNNSQRYESIENFDEPSTFTNNNKQQSILSPMAKESLLKAPLITPRKSLQQKSSQKQQQSELNFSDEPSKRHNNNNNNKSRSTNQFENSENEFISNSSSFEESKLNKLKNSRNLEMFSASRTNFKDDDTDSQTQNAPPVPVPRKREQTSKLLNNNNNNFFNSNTENDFKIKRNNSASTNKQPGYMPSPRTNDPNEQENTNRKIDINKQYIRYQNDLNVPIIKDRSYNSRDDSKSSNLLSSRKQNSNGLRSLRQ